MSTPAQPASTTPGPAANGLDDAEAARRLAADGPNTLARDARRGLLAFVGETLREPMFLMLFACGGIYLALGDLQEALTLLACVVLVSAITIVQAARTEKAVAALRELSSPRALVVRGGERRRIAGAAVVRGDLVLLAEGDRVPADALVREATNLAIDESLLTGESMPVEKPSAGDRVAAGTLVVRGHALTEVTATGARSELGKIGASLAALKPAPSRVQQEIRRLIIGFGSFGALCCVVVVLVYGLGSGAWLPGLLAGVTLAMSLLPEEFTVVLTVFLALGAWRMSRRHVLVRRIPALENLGAATTLCVDKTGTLTQNRMTLVELQAGAHTWQDDGGRPPEPFHEVVEFAALASQREAFDPMDAACQRFVRARVGEPEHIHDTWELLTEHPLTPELLAVSHVWRGPDGTGVVACKGATDAVADLCRLDEPARAPIREAVAAMTARGLRVLGVARAPLTGPPQARQQDYTFTWVGLLGLQDPPRPEVSAALTECRAAGVRVMMVTGDHPGTATAIARAVGLTSDAVLTGPEIAALADAELRARLLATPICARVMPDQKLRIVQTLTAAGEVVAMTGDGVNDAPALRAAAIGVAMGERGTDVAREAAAIVLTRDDFSDLVAAVAEGRRISDNLRKALGFIVAVHVPIAGVALVPLFFGLPMLLHPIHIVFLELIIDPACSIVFEAEPAEPENMRRPPRPQAAPLLDRRTLLRSVAEGLCALAACLAVLYYSLLYLGQPVGVAQSATFATLVLANLGLILVQRTRNTSLRTSLRAPNPALWIVLAATLALLIATLEIPPLQRVFHFAPVPWLQLLLGSLLGPLSVLWWIALRRPEPASAR